MAAASAGTDGARPLPFDPSTVEVWRSRDGRELAGYWVPAHTTTAPEVAFVFFHGAGMTAQTFSHCAEFLQYISPCFAMDIRGHGRSEKCIDLSIESLVADGEEFVSRFVSERVSPEARVILVGHSLGGSIASRVAQSLCDARGAGDGPCAPAIAALVLLDVAETQAIASLDHFASHLERRPETFASLQEAAEYMTRHGWACARDPSHISLQSQLRRLSSSSTKSGWTWRADILSAKDQWEGWFHGLVTAFLALEIPRLIITPSADRLDPLLTVAMMQGKFSVRVLGSSGHLVQEEQPARIAQEVVEWAARVHVLGAGAAALRARIAQLRGSNDHDE